MSTDEIAKTIALLKVTTIQEALKQAGNATPNSKTNKTELIKLYESAVMDVGIEKFIQRINDSLVSQTAKLVGSEENKAALIKKVQSITIGSLLTQASATLLEDFGKEMGLEVNSDKKEMEQSIADEAMLTGMEGFLHKLTPATLKKHCTELSLPSDAEKKELVERLMVHIFELEPLAPPSASATEEEEAKPKENKKRKDAPEKADKKAKKAKADKSDKKDKKEKKDKKDKKEKKEEKEDKKDETPSKRASRAKKDDEEEEEEEEKKVKTPKKGKTPKKEEEEATPSKRTPGGWVAPPLTTIVKGGKYDNYTALYDNFNLTDLQEYCRQQDMKPKGVKKDVIKHILSYLATGDKSDPKSKKTPTKTPKKDAKEATGEADKEKEKEKKTKEEK